MSFANRTVGHGGQCGHLPLFRINVENFELRYWNWIVHVATLLLLLRYGCCC